MTTMRLIELGICDDLDECLRMFPIETLQDFRPRHPKPGAEADRGSRPELLTRCQ